MKKQIKKRKTKEKEVKSNKPKWYSVSLKFILVFLAVLIIFDLIFAAMYHYHPLVEIVTGIPRMISDYQMGEAIEKGDESVPALTKKLYNSDKDTKYKVIVALLQIDTERSRKALKDAFYHGNKDVSSYVAWMIAQEHKNMKAFEDIYVDIINKKYNYEEDNYKYVRNWSIWNLSELKCKKALPGLEKIVKEAVSWRSFFAASMAIREIKNISNDKENEIKDFIRTPLYENEECLNDSGSPQYKRCKSIVLEDKDYFLPVIVNWYFYNSKDTPGTKIKFFKDVIESSGDSASQYLKIALNDKEDKYIRFAVSWYLKDTKKERK